MSKPINTAIVAMTKISSASVNAAARAGWGDPEGTGAVFTGTSGKGFLFRSF
jgi:hypothetical protein